MLIPGGGPVDGTWLCDREEPQYLAPPYEWVLVFESLQKAVREEKDGRHPRSGEWEEAYGRGIPGGSTSPSTRSAENRCSTDS